MTTRPTMTMLTSVAAVAPVISNSPLSSYPASAFQSGDSLTLDSDDVSDQGVADVFDTVPSGTVEFSGNKHW